MQSASFRITIKIRPYPEIGEGWRKRGNFARYKKGRFFLRIEICKKSLADSSAENCSLKQYKERKNEKIKENRIMYAFARVCRFGRHFCIRCGLCCARIQRYRRNPPSVRRGGGHVYGSDDIRRYENGRNLSDRRHVSDRYRGNRKLQRGRESAAYLI